MHRPGSSVCAGSLSGQEDAEARAPPARPGGRRGDRLAGHDGVVDDAVAVVVDPVADEVVGVGVDLRVAIIAVRGRFVPVAVAVGAERGAARVGAVAASEVQAWEQAPSTRATRRGPCTHSRGSRDRSSRVPSQGQGPRPQRAKRALLLSPGAYRSSSGLDLIRRLARRWRRRPAPPPPSPHCLLRLRCRVPPRVDCSGPPLPLGACPPCTRHKSTDRRRPRAGAPASAGPTRRPVCPVPARLAAAGARP